MSQFFFKTVKETPKDEVSLNAKLLTRAGFIQKLSAGVYSYLPLGLRVLNKIENIIREEMNNIAGQELLMPALHPKEIWEESGRWKTADYLYKLKDRQGKEYALGATHEEVISDIARKYISSYRDLPLSLYQIQTKFRDELRPKSGLLRTKEFSMKDLYSFHADEKDFKKYYEQVKKTYLKIFERCGFGEIIVAEAGGGTFTNDYTHEFQIPTEAGEDAIVFCPKGDYARNREIADRKKGDKCPKCGAILKDVKTIEVGNIFPLSTRFSEPMAVNFIDKNGEKKPVIMGCYGIGPSRVMGAAVEVHHDENGIVWPDEIAPFRAHLIKISNLKSQISKIDEFSDKIYQDLQKKDVEVLYDDRGEKTAGEKFADADLIGIPWRLVISEKTLKQDAVELKKRDEQKVKLIKIKDLRF
ncbi:MAG: proline--tRNA ligase [Candidatus Tagabacteria bacterium]